MIQKKSNRHGVKDVVSKVVRKLASGEERKYVYKLFRIYHIDGKPTTVSMEFEDYFRLCSRFKIGQADVSAAMRQAARRTFARSDYDSTKSHSAQVRKCAINMLTAQAKGVTLDEYEAALANNDAWTR